MPLGIAGFHRTWSLVFIALLGMGGCGNVSCRRHVSTDAGPAPSAAASATGPRATRDVKVSPALLDRLRRRRFDEAFQVFEALAPAERAIPEVRLQAAFAAVKTGQGERAVGMLEDLGSRLAVVERDIRYLRARAQLVTRDALVGAEYLCELGASDAWVMAAETLERLGQSASARIACARGLAKDASNKGAQVDWRRARLYAVRARVLSEQGGEGLEALRWLSTAGAGSPEGEPLVTSPTVRSAINLSPAERKARIQQLAERGKLEALEQELEAVRAKGQIRLGRAESLYLRGRVRMVSRREQREGAALLAEAARLGYGDVTQLRFDAAKMLVREGAADEACRLYDSIALSNRRRAEEARYYAARAQAILGDPSQAERRYARLLKEARKGEFADDALYERTLNQLHLGRSAEAQAGLLRLLELARYRDRRPELKLLLALSSESQQPHEQALKRYREVAMAYPMHPAGLFARTRLIAEKDRPSARSASPSREAYALDPSATPRAAQLLKLGLDELAARALREEERQLAVPASASRRAQCAFWGAVGYGSRGYALSSELREQTRLFAVPEPDNRWAFDCRFPTPYESVVQEFEQKRALPEHLIHAIMRQESGFNPEVVSPANARGLLQLLPTTAERIRIELGGATDDLGMLDLAEPRVNVELGSGYLAKLLQVFDGDLVLSIAAYNAGPKAVIQWAQKARGMRPELFLARIPYAETRGYVDRVLSNLAMYRYLAFGDEGLPDMPTKLPEKLELSEALY